MSVSSTYRSLRLNKFEPDQMAELISLGSFEHFLFGNQPCDVSHEHWEYGDLMLDHAKYSFGTWVRGQFRPDRICIGFLREVTHASWINGAEVRSLDLQVYAENCELAYRTYDQAHWIAIQLRREDLQRAATKLLQHELRLPVSGMLNLHPPVETMLNLQQIFDLCCVLFRKGDQSAERCREMLLVGLVHAIAGADVLRAEQEALRCQRAFRMVKLAELYLLTHLSTGYCSEEFSRAVGMSERNLEVHFKKIFGLSPRKWREYVCLNIAHRKLTQARHRPGIVAEIAADCGFTHPSRFSAVYRGLFGELPFRTYRGE